MYHAGRVLEPQGDTDAHRTEWCAQCGLNATEYGRLLPRWFSLITYILVLLLQRNEVVRRRMLSQEEQSYITVSGYVAAS
jgi:hypothetical protein